MSCIPGSSSVTWRSLQCPQVLRANSRIRNICVACMGRCVLRGTPAVIGSNPASCTMVRRPDFQQQHYAMLLLGYCVSLQHLALGEQMNIHLKASGPPSTVA
ncbi:hypothetical protein CBL_10282 [Carabus blaptoides fortunei]